MPPACSCEKRELVELGGMPSAPDFLRKRAVLGQFTPTVYAATSREEIIVWVPMVVVVAVRAVAIRFDLHLPRTSKN